VPNETSNVQSTQQSSPFLPNMGYLQKGFGEADKLLDRPTPSLTQLYNNIQSRQGGEYAQQFKDIEQSALDIARTGGYSASPELQRFTSGSMLSPDSNPWLKGAYEDAAGAVRGQVASQFAGAGRYGSGANQDILGQNLGKLANQFYGGAYQQGVGQMLQASLLGEQLEGQNANRRLQGAALYPQLLNSRDAELQKLASMERGDDMWTNLQRYMGIVNPGVNFGNTQTNNTPYSSNPFGQAVGGVGGALSALSLGRQAFGNPFDWFGGGGMSGIDLGTQLSQGGGFDFLGDSINAATFDPNWLSYGF
jgi:hypothetical protein